jgi:WD40 repeat protein
VQSVGFNTATWDIDNRTALQAISFSKVLIPAVLRQGSFYHESFFVRYSKVTTRDYTNLGDGYEYKSDPFSAIALSADAQYLLLGNYVTSGMEVWQVGKPTAPLFTFAGHQGPIWGMAAAPDGQTFYSAGVDGSLRQWKTGQEKPSVEISGFYPSLTDIAFNPQDGSLLAASTAGTVFTFGDGQFSGFFGAPQNKAEWKNVYAAVYSSTTTTGDACWLGFNSNGSQLLEGCSTNGFLPRLRQNTDLEQVSTYTLAGYTLPGFTLPGYTDPLVGVEKGNGWVKLSALSPDGSRVAVAYTRSKQDNDIRIFDTTSGALLTKLKMKTKGDVDSLEFSPDGRWLAAGGYSLPVVIFDVQSGAKVAELPLDQPNQQGVVHIRFSPDGLYLATVEYGYALLYDTTTWQIKAAMDPQGGDRDYEAIAFLPGEHTLVVSVHSEAYAMTELNTAHDGLYFWEYATGSTAQRFELPSTHGVRDLEVSPDGQTLAVLQFDGRILLLGVK